MTRAHMLPVVRIGSSWRQTPPDAHDESRNKGMDAQRTKKARPSQCVCRQTGRLMAHHAHRQHGGHLALVPAGRFSTLTAIVLSIVLLGNLAATTPLAWASQAIGWRGVFAAAVAFTALAAIAAWLLVRDAPPGHPFLARTPEPPRQMLQGLMEVLRNPRLKPILALNFCNYACTFTALARLSGVRLGYTAAYLCDLARVRPVLWAISVIISAVIFLLPPSGARHAN